MEFIANVVIYRCVYTEDNDKNKISRNPAKCKSIPERPDRKIAVCPIRHICITIVDESQRSHQDRENNPEDICVVTVWIETSFPCDSWLEYVQGSMNGNHEDGKICRVLASISARRSSTHLMLQFRGIRRSHLLGRTSSCLEQGLGRKQQLGRP
jgi:hypothetical protein